MKKEIIEIEDGNISCFYGEQVPSGFYWVVLDVMESTERATDIHYLTNRWQGAILVGGSAVYKQSPQRSPLVGSSFVVNGDPYHYELQLKCFYKLEDAEKFVSEGKADAGFESDYDWRFIVKEPYYKNIKVQFTKTSDEIQGNNQDLVWLLDKIQGMNHDLVWMNEWSDDSYQREQTEEQRIAQRQVDLNSARITKLEKELKNLRELQKLLKGMR